MKYLFSILLLLLIGNSGFAQDVITTRAGEDIKGRVTEIGLTEVKYQPLDAPEGSVSTISKDKVLLIRYEDGGKEIFEQPVAATPDLLPKSASGDNTGVVSSLSNTSMFMRGQIDAKRYYKGFKDPTVGALIGTLVLGPVLGLIPTIAITSTVPQAVNLNYPSESLMRNPQYAQGYVREAKHIKSRKSWVGYAIGAVVSTVISAILISVALSNLTF